MAMSPNKQHLALLRMGHPFLLGLGGLSPHIAPCLPAETSLADTGGPTCQELYPDKNQLLPSKALMSAHAPKDQQVHRN